MPRRPRQLLRRGAFLHPVTASSTVLYSDCKKEVACAHHAIINSHEGVKVQLRLSPEHMSVWCAYMLSVDATHKDALHPGCAP